MQRILVSKSKFTFCYIGEIEDNERQYLYITMFSCNVAKNGIGLAQVQVPVMEYRQLTQWLNKTIAKFITIYFKTQHYSLLM